MAKISKPSVRFTEAKVLFIFTDRHSLYSLDYPQICDSLLRLPELWYYKNVPYLIFKYPEAR